MKLKNFNFFSFFDAIHRKSSSLIYIFFLFLIIFAVYGRSLSFGFVWDDNGAVVYNSNITSFSNALKTFYYPVKRNFSKYNPAHLTTSNYRPLRTFLHALIYKTGGLTPFYYHLMNILFHILAACMLFIIMRKFFPDIYAFGGTLIFAIHPVTTEVVCWVKCVEDSMAAFFLLLSINTLISVKSLSKRKEIFMLLIAGLFFMLALLSKLSVAFLPLFIFIYLNTCFKDSNKLKETFEGSGRFLEHRENIYFWFCAMFLFFTEMCIVIGMRKITVEKIAQGDYITGSCWTTWLSMPRIFCHYMQLLIFPCNLCVDYETFPAANSFTDIKAWLFVITFAGLFIIPTYIFFKRKLFFIGWLWIWTALLPFANIVPMVQLGADRFLYIALMGYAGLIVCFLQTLKIRRYLSLLILFLIVLGYALLTYQRISIWENEITLWESMRYTMPQGNRAAKNLIKAYLSKGKVKQALIYAEELIKVHNNSENLALLGFLLCINGREKEGLPLLIKTKDHVVLNIVGAIAAKQGKYNFAKLCFEYAHKFTPDIQKYVINLNKVEKIIADKRKLKK